MTPQITAELAFEYMSKHASKLRSLMRIVETADGPARKYEMLMGDNLIGSVALTTANGIPELRYTRISEKLRGMGLGKKMYGEIIKRQPNMTLRSDRMVSDDASRVWEALAKNPDYSVAKNPKAIHSSAYSEWQVPHETPPKPSLAQQLIDRIYGTKPTNQDNSVYQAQLKFKTSAYVSNRSSELRRLSSRGMQKTALPIKRVLSTLSVASSRGVPHDRLNRYVNTLEKWIDGAARRHSRVFRDYNFSADVPDSWFRNSEVIVKPGVREAISSAIVGRHGRQVDKMLRHPALENTLTSLGDPPQLIAQVSRGRESLLHEVGHAKKPFLHALDSSYARTRWSDELAANKAVADALPKLVTEIPDMPSAQAYRQWAMKQQLENYRLGMLRDLIVKSPQSWRPPSYEVGKKNVGFLQRFIDALPPDRKTTVLSRFNEHAVKKQASSAGHQRSAVVPRHA